MRTLEEMAYDLALRDGWEVALALGLAAFAAVVVLSLAVLLPGEHLVFATDARRAYESLYGVGVDEARRSVAYWIQETRRATSRPSTGK